MNDRDLHERLAQPFSVKEVRFKPLTTNGNRALAAAYVDVRVIMQRLDDVFGVGGWKDDYAVVSGGSVICRLSVKVGEEWIEKTDVGSPSKQPGDGDKLKAAFSDALKRAAIKLGIGRYLYRLPRQWVDYDPQKKQFTKTPGLPDWALPKRNENAKSAPVEHSQPTPPSPSNGTSGGFRATLDKMAGDWQAKGYCQAPYFWSRLAAWSTENRYPQDANAWNQEVIGHARTFLSGLLDDLKNPAPAVLVDEIDRLLGELRWSKEQTAKWRTERKFPQQGQPLSEHRAQAMVLAIKQELRDGNAVETVPTREPGDDSEDEGIEF